MKKHHHERMKHHEKMKDHHHEKMMHHKKKMSHEEHYESEGHNMAKKGHPYGGDGSNSMSHLNHGTHGKCRLSGKMS